jgi:hypothetical protein
METVAVVKIAWGEDKRMSRERREAGKEWQGQRELGKRSPVVVSYVPAKTLSKAQKKKKKKKNVIDVLFK